MLENTVHGINVQEQNCFLVVIYRVRVGLYLVASIHFKVLLGCVAQLVTYLTADPGVASSIQPSKRRYVHKVLVNRLVKLAQEKSVVR